MPRVTLTAQLTILAIVAVLLCLLIPVERHAAWIRLARQMGASITEMKPTAPNSVSPADWECAHGWVVTAYWNICFSPNHVKADELNRLRRDLDMELKGTIDLDVLKRIWTRLGETGPHGKSYIERYESQFRGCFPQGT